MNFKEYRYQIVYDSSEKWVSNWFSNMISCDIIVDGKNYKSTESYYQSRKTTNKEDRDYIASLNGQRSKIEVRKCLIREDWNDIKINVMRKALIAKFNINEWKQKLLETGNEPIIEWNNWNDKFWGVSIIDFKGQNNLGKLLMDFRESHKYKSLF